MLFAQNVGNTWNKILTQDLEKNMKFGNSLFQDPLLRYHL